MQSSAFTDMRYNPVMEVMESEFVQATNVSPDTTRPILYDFSLDLNSGTLTFNFSEFVDPATYMPHGGSASEYNGRH